MDQRRTEKRRRLDGILRDPGGAVIGFSGGVDSSYLCAAAVAALGDRAPG